MTDVVKLGRDAAEFAWNEWMATEYEPDAEGVALRDPSEEESPADGDYERLQEQLGRDATESEHAAFSRSYADRVQALALALVGEVEAQQEQDDPRYYGFVFADGRSTRFADGRIAGELLAFEDRADLDNWLLAARPGQIREACTVGDMPEGWRRWDAEDTWT